jgi:phosphatidylserine decarboxylase
VKKLFLNIIPKTFISKVAGYLAEITIPSSLRVWVYTKYAKIYGVNLNEIENELDSYLK